MQSREYDYPMWEEFNMIGSGGIYKDREQDDSELENEELFTIPEVKGLMKDLGAALAKEHSEEMEEDKKKGKKRAPKRAGVICICGGVGCGIGPMREVG